MVWKASKTFDMDVEPFRQKIDLRLTGRYLHWRAGSWEGVRMVESGSCPGLTSTLNSRASDERQV